MILYEKTHTVDISETIINFLILKKQNNLKLRGNCNLLIKVKFNELE